MFTTIYYEDDGNSNLLHMLSIFCVFALLSRAVLSIRGGTQSTTLSPLAHNGMAAWRSGGFSALPFKFARPAAVAPNRSLGDGIFEIVVLFYFDVGLYIIIGTVPVCTNIHISYNSCISHYFMLY